MEWVTDVARVFSEWSKDISNRNKKEEVANEIALNVRNHDIIGIGSGSTSFLALKAIAKRIAQEKINIIAIPTSGEVALACSALGIQTTTLLQLKPDWAFDGADEVDPQSNLIKGRGGAMFLEKLVLKSSSKNYILVDESKCVQTLGEKFAIPVEVYPSAIHLVENNLKSAGAIECKLRMAISKDGPVITESGNYILDTRFKEIESSLEKEIKQIPGVIESGLFIGYDVQIIRA